MATLGEYRLQEGVGTSVRHTGMNSQSQVRFHTRTVVGVPLEIRGQNNSRERHTMRWYWVDKFIEFNSGESAKAVKNVSLAEEHLHDHFPGFPVMPGSLMIEGMAQTGGILLGETNDFAYNVILAKVPKVEFHSWACPGDQLIYTATLVDAKEEGGSVEVKATVGDRLVAEAEIMFVHLSSDDPQLSRIDQKNFVFKMNLLDILKVGKAGTGEAESADEAAPAS